MLHDFTLYIALVMLILLLVMLAHKIRTAYPVVLVLGGLAISLIPGMPVIHINPELIFVIFLPPLLYEAAWYTSWKEFWRWRRVIGSFAFLIVIATSLVVALVASHLIPGFTLALGFLLGGIVSPPDAVSATAILKHVKVPKRMSSILEGESLLNDASSLIVFRFAFIAVDTGRFVFHEAALSFVWVIAGGILTGLAVGCVFYFLHRKLPTDANTDVVMSLATPYVMYIAAESIHVSGVLAVVSGGLFLSAKSHLFLSHRSRLRGANVWAAFGFVLNGLVFMLIGLELPVIVAGLGDVSLRQAIGYGVLITVVLMVARVLSTLGASAFTVFISRYITTADSRPGWKAPLVFGWAGMRGVVSLAAALSIPVYVTSGAAFPQRNLILFITFVVILLTLVVQGLTLPLVIRWLQLDDPDHFLPEAEQNRIIRQKLSDRSLAWLREHHSDALGSNTALQQLAAKWEQETVPDESEWMQDGYRAVYLQLLAQQRAWLREWNKEVSTDEEVIRKYQLLLDVEEEKMRLRFE
ncbi:Na+/H+ antiporter [Chitinophaga cymbidii]|uniref:Na+/H+ antiporter n=1 Tax=Chitinophaga cymbidii TaxID=1096750 RepID=A0A512RNY6_9BACT|nr:Na+/H+ antiporter [Chitinophaga cymbidii]GEP97394.1 Na+/H+ antiporter [Chitinophaga cymbidii]